MKILYQSDDGHIFESEWDCRDYEFTQSLEDIDQIKIYREDNKPITTPIMNDFTYNNSEKIIVPTDAAARSIQNIAEYMGYLAWGTIDSAGTWIFNKPTEVFVKEIKIGR